MDLIKLRDKIINKHCLTYDGDSDCYRDENGEMRLMFSRHNMELRYWTDFYDKYFISLYFECDNKPIVIYRKPNIFLKVREFMENYVKPKMLRRELDRIIDASVSEEN